MQNETTNNKSRPQRRYRGRNNNNRSYVNSPKPSGKPVLTVCTLSGVSEVGRNCNFIEYGDDILVIDAGFSFPGHEMYGIDYLIPNTTYLRKNKHKIRALLITHGHLDHTGAIQYIMNDLGNPTIYAGAFATSLIKDKLNETPLKGKTTHKDVFRNTVLQFGAFKVTFIGVTHSIPNAYSIFVESPGGNVFFSGDYKIDQAPENEPETDYTALKGLRGKVDLALMESTNPDKEGKAISAQEVAGNLMDVINNQKGRVVVAMFSSLLSRLYSVIKIAEKTNRKVFVSGRSLITALRIAREHNYISYPEDLIIGEDKLSKFPDDKILYICTGSQGEKYSALNRISLNQHKYFKLKEGDLVLLSASGIPTNLGQIEKMTDRLIDKGADILQNSEGAIHESGHALKIDMKMMFELVEPTSVIPIHGSLTMRYKNRKNYLKWGMREDNVHLTKDGQKWLFRGGKWSKGAVVDAKPVLIDGLGVGDIGEAVIKDREQLAEYGMVTVVMNLSSKNYRMIGKPKFVSRGFVYVNTSQKLFSELGALVVQAHSEWLNKGDAAKRHNTSELLESVEKTLAKFIFKRTERMPKILPVII